MSWYSAAVTGKVPSYVATKEKWDIRGYIAVGSDEYMKFEDMREDHKERARQYFRDHIGQPPAHLVRSDRWIGYLEHRGLSHERQN